MINKAQALAARHAQEFFFVSRKDNKVKRVRVSGECKTWVTRPDEFRLPIKFGLRESHYIDQDNCHAFYATEQEAQGKPAIS